ncbi:MAG: FGGY family carbohydrate kinase [Chloroflexota bacterium]
MRPTACLGLDLGTSSLKALVLDREGRTLATASAAYPLDAPHPGWSETDPAAWWSAAVSAGRTALAAAGNPEIAGIGLDGQMHAPTLVDADNRPVRPAVIWSDGRAGSSRSAFAAFPPDLRRRLANPFQTGAGGPVLGWLAEHEPEVLARARWALLPKDAVRTHLVEGEPVSDASDASATLLWDVPADGWADDLAAAWGADARLLPRIAPSSAVAGPLSAEGAAALGLERGIPVAVGASDAAAAALGAGLVRTGAAQLTVGTGAQCIVIRDDPAPDPTGRTHLYRAAPEGQWYAMAAVQNSGLALDWVRRMLGVEWSRLFATIPDGPPPADAPYFVPNLTEERPYQPYPGPGAAFTAAQLHHTADDLLAAAVEGVALGIALAVAALPGVGGPGPLRLSGGASLDAGYRQLLADVLGRDLETVAVADASGRGAALLGAVAAGWWADPIGASLAVAPASGQVTPWRPAHHDAWEARRAGWSDAARRVGAPAAG